MTVESDTRLLPEVLAMVAEATSLPVALRLAADLGGTRLWLPERPQPGSALVQAVGQEAAERICDALGPGKVTIPLGPTATFMRRAKRIRELLAEGHSQSEIARLLHIHVRTVERHASRAGGGDDPRQGRLLDLTG